MIVSHKLQTIFVHIQKTGGSAIEQALRFEDSTIGSHLTLGRRHIPASEFRTLIAPELWTRYYKFAFVRNPWDRLVSWYAMCQKPGGNDFTRYIKQNYLDFGSFVRSATQGIAARTARNQYDFLYDQDGNCLVDFIGRFENLNDDFQKVAVHLGITPAQLPLVNTSQHKPYRDYYTEETRDIVAIRFHKDLAAFGYEF